MSELNPQGLKKTLRAIVARALWGAVSIATILSPALAELPREIRVVSYNIHHGEGVDGKFDLPRIAKVILAEKPDIIALQEVDQKTRRASGIDQAAELARLTSMVAVFGHNVDMEGGGYGTAVLTKLPVRSHESLKLKSYELSTGSNPEQRGVQVIELGAPEGPGLLFLCTHLDYRKPADERMNSARTINELAKKRGNELAIIAGDFNATPESQEIHEFAKEWTIASDGDTGKSTFTFPAKKPDRRLDYVMYRPARRWKAVEVRVLDEAVASDHRALLTVLRRLP